MQEKEELKLTYSCILQRGKDKIVRVTFERKDAYAEGTVPGGEIESQYGFSEEEISQLKNFLNENSIDIIQRAKKITGIQHWLK